MIEPIKAVVFDLDGLIFDTEHLFFKIAVEYCRDRGSEFTPEVMRAMIGRQSPQSIANFQRLTGLSGTHDELLADLRERFNAEVDTAVHPMPGLFALLAHLNHRGIPRAVATSSRTAYAQGLLTRHNLIDQFSFVLAAEDVTRGKPDPEIYLKAAARLGAEPKNTLVLEDTPTGLNAALASGAFAVGVPHEHSPAEDLAHAHLIVTSLDDRRLLERIDWKSD